MRKGYLPMAHVGVAGDDVVVGATRLAPACMHASVCVRVHASMRVRECMVDEHKSMRLRVYVNVCMHAVVGAANVFIFHTSPFHPLPLHTSLATSRQTSRLLTPARSADKENTAVSTCSHGALLLHSHGAY